MKTRQSTCSSLLLLILSVSLVDGVSDVKEACTKTPHPELCMKVLSASPESKTADARGLVQIAMHTAFKLGRAAANFTRAEQGKLNIHNPDEDTQWRCMYSCVGYIVEAISIMKKGKAIDDAKLIEVRRFFEMAKNDLEWQITWKWDCVDCLKGHANEDLVSKNNDFTKIVDIIPALIKQTPGGDKPLPPEPPSPPSKPSWEEPDY